MTSHIRILRRRGAHIAMAASLLLASGAVATASAHPFDPPSATSSQAAALTPSGSIAVREAGAVVDSLHVNGSIAVRADNVTIRNTTVTYSGPHSIRIYPGVTGTRIVDTTVECAGPRTNGVVFGGYTAERVSLNDCRNDFMFSDRNPATVIDSSNDGVPFSTDNTTPSPEPTPDPTPSPEPTPDPIPSPEPTPAPEPVDPGDFPTKSTTGPRVGAEQTTGALTTSRDGQVIERTTVNGRLTIQNDNVTVRDVTVNGTGTYMIYVLKTADGSCPTNVRVEYTEINGKNAPATSIPMYAPQCGFTFDHGLIQDIGRGIRIANDVTISNSYLHLTRTWDGAHRAGISTHGGRNIAVKNNVIMCENVGCSAAVTMYGDHAPVDGYLLQGNLIATTGSYCIYGGSVPSKNYPHGTNVRIVDNHFSTKYFDTCGRYGPVTSHDSGVRGNTFTGNVWHESGQPVRR